MRKALFVMLLTALLPLTGARGATIPQDDAGSGQDAPDVATAGFTVAPGQVYAGTIEGFPLEERDWYAFHAPAGAVLEARAASALGCIYLVDAAGVELDFGCATGTNVATATAAASAAGTYYVRYGYLEAHTYRFSVGVDAPAPDPALAETRGLTVFPSGGVLAPVAPAAKDDDHVVVAVVDTGINPYHEFFRAPALTGHPSDWLPGFPAAAAPVGLTFTAPDYATAAAADDATFAGLERSTYDYVTDTYDEHLYTFPGTRVVGAVSFGEYTETETPGTVPVQTRPVRDDNGHGTHSAGLVAGANLAAADGNVLIVAVEVTSGAFDTGVRWAARQPWIDAISMSLGTAANVPLPSALAGGTSTMQAATLEATASGKPVFVAAGNGVSDTGLAPDKCSTYTSGYTGPAWVTRVGAAHPDDGSPTWWHCVPVEAVARTDVASPSYDTLRGGDKAGGTSAATPNLAGHFAHLLLAGRRAGSAATRHRTLEHLLHAAAPVPLKPGLSDPSAYPLSLADQGYGLVDQRALDAATARLLAGSGPLPRPETETWFSSDAALRRALWGPGSATGGPDPALIETVNDTLGTVYQSEWQDDAGSGRDAPNELSDDVRVQPGAQYEAILDGLYDQEDWYAFEGTAGDVAQVHLLTATASCDIVGPDGAVASTSYCGGSATTLPTSGTWYLRVYDDVTHQYQFTFTLDGTPPRHPFDPVAQSEWQDDAGSGRDAPNAKSDDVRVQPGVRYEAVLDTVYDREDWYAFEGTAGDVARFSSLAVACFDLVAPDGAVASSSCGSFDTTLPTSGTWYLRVHYDVPQQYRFAFTLDGSSPPALAP